MPGTQIDVNISKDAGNALITGTDSGLFVAAGGSSLTLKGGGKTEAEIKAINNAKPGDTYYAKDKGDLWSWDGTKWVDVGHIKGADGTSGATYIAGKGIAFTPKP